MLTPTCRKGDFPAMKRAAPAAKRAKIKNSSFTAKNSVVKVDPMFVPKMSGIERLNERAPTETNPMTITINAELLCKIPVNIILTKKAFTG